MSEPAFSRILLKLSGEILSGDLGYGIDPEITKNLAEKIGSNILSQQSNDGGWHSVEAPMLRNDATAEMVVWLDEIYQATRE